jgi:EAL domain-containing protein (putative c-di-GMP-specific phosphodiesterase class I)/GGDEF domain-containing protein
VSRFELRPVDLPVAPAAGAERYTRALVELTRTVWHPGCTFETAIAPIAATAMSVLRVERVSVWQFDQESGRLECLCTSDAACGAHRPEPALPPVPLANTDLVSTLREVRTFEGVEVDGATAAQASAAQDDFRSYLQRSQVRALLNAPAYVEGELLGIICHESVGRVRQWTSEEVMFAASMGDYVAMAYEIARRRRAESEIEHLRLHDGSTGLGNRDYMLELIRQRMDTSRAPGETLALVHVLVDATGGVAWSADAPSVDEVMTGIARRLRRLSSGAIDIARVRDNAFAFLLASDDTQRSAVRLAERVIAAIRAMTWNHEEVDPSVTVGIAFADSEGADDPRVCLRQAEEAAEHARAEKFSYEIFDPEHHAALVETLRFERTLREAFDAGEFELHYQPEFDAGARQWVAAEGLLRWRREDRVVTAADFIGVIEATGLMLPVGRWVLQRACTDAAAWPDGPGGPTAVRVNVSARQFDEDGLIADVEAALASSGLPPGRLCLELTETTLMRDINRTQGVLERLREIGVHVAIDDFGTGYASLVYLKRLPVDALKIDRSFVEGMPGASTDAAIIRAVVGLASSLRMQVIAEGVETLAQQDALLALGVTRMQGWLYGKAMPQEQLRAVLAAAPPG